MTSSGCAGGHQVAFGHVDADDRALHRRRDRHRAVGRRAPAVGDRAVSRRRAACRGRARPAGRSGRPGRRPGPAGPGGSLEEQPPMAMPAEPTSSADVVLDEAGVDPVRRRSRDGAAGSAGSRCWWPPLDPELAQGPVRPGATAASTSHEPASGRSAWPAGSRSWGWCGSRRSRRCRPGRPAPDGDFERGRACRPPAGSRRRRPSSPC